ncbi:MAG: hypothetical protein M3R00_08365 [Pseudomonadota bacterium]|nr:hypothetical protein [Pseudomonadota bacterium]
MANEDNEKLEKEAAQAKKPALDYLADSHNNVYAGVPHRAANALYLLLAVVVLSFIWSYFAKIDEHTVAEGKIIASGQIKKIQHLEGGIVKKILPDWVYYKRRLPDILQKRKERIRLISILLWKNSFQLRLHKLIYILSAIKRRWMRV